MVAAKRVLTKGRPFIGFVRPRADHAFLEVLWVPIAVVMVLAGFILLRVAAVVQSYTLVVFACLLVVTGLAAVAPRLRRA